MSFCDDVHGTGLENGQEGGAVATGVLDALEDVMEIEIVS